MLSFALISIVTFGLVNLVILLMSIQFAQLNYFFGIFSGNYKKEKSDCSQFYLRHCLLLELSSILT